MTIKQLWDQSGDGNGADDARDAYENEQVDAPMSACRCEYCTTSDPMWALVEAISWSNANLEFSLTDIAVDSGQDHRVAFDILRGLAHLGWRLVKTCDRREEALHEEECGDFHARWGDVS